MDDDSPIDIDDINFELTSSNMDNEPDLGDDDLCCQQMSIQLHSLMIWLTLSIRIKNPIHISRKNTIGGSPAEFTLVDYPTMDDRLS